jgi:hypothetical protein
VDVPEGGAAAGGAAPAPQPHRAAHDRGHAGDRPRGGGAGGYRGDREPRGDRDARPRAPVAIPDRAPFGVFIRNVPYTASEDDVGDAFYDKKIQASVREGGAAGAGTALLTGCRGLPAPAATGRGAGHAHHGRK